MAKINFINSGPWIYIYNAVLFTATAPELMKSIYAGSFLTLNLQFFCLSYFMPFLLVTYMYV